MKLSSMAICILFLFLMCGYGNAIVLYQNDSQLILTSDQIVYGKIVDVQSAWTSENTQIETTAQILVDQAFIQSGTNNISSGTTISVTIMGGMVGNITEWVEDMPIFVPNTEAFVYLNKRSDGKYSVNGLYQGIHIINNDKTKKSITTQSTSSTGDIEKFKEIIKSTLNGTSTDPALMEIPGTSSGSLDASGPTINSAVVTTVSPNTASAGTNTVITISGSGFGEKASRESNADVAFLYKAKSPLEDSSEIYATGFPRFPLNVDDVISWTNSKIIVKVPTGICGDLYSCSAGSGYIRIYTDAGTVSNYIPFTVTFGYGKTKWIDPVTFVVNGTMVSGSATAVQNAATTWNTAIPGSSFRLNYGGLSNRTTAGSDGRNLIYFGPPSDFSNNPDVIARASTFYSDEGIITEADIEFNTNWTWTTGNATGDTMNVEAIVLHELGHWLSLKDLYGYLPEVGTGGFPSDISPQPKVMVGVNNDALGNKNLKTLSPADIAGIRWIYLSDHTVNSNVTKTGVYRPGAGFYLKNSSGSSWNPSTDAYLAWDNAVNDRPIAGDWNSDGRTETGVYRPGAGFYLKMNSGSSWNPSTDAYRPWDNAVNDRPVAGDWNGDGRTETGVYRPGAGFYLKMDSYLAWNPSSDVYLAWDNAANDLPVAGDWNGDGRTETGVYRPGAGFYLKMNSGNSWNPSSDVYLAWDNARGDLPISGNFV